MKNLLSALLTLWLAAVALAGTEADVPVQSGLVQLSGGYVFHRPVVLDADNVEITGGTITAQCTPAFAVGIRSITPDHYPLSTITGKTAYRTLGNARINLPAELFDVSSTSLTIEFIVEQNTPTTQQVGLFGTIRRQIPQPWYCAVVNNFFQFRYALADGTVKSYSVPWPAGVVTGKVSLDLNAGTLVIVLNGDTKANITVPTGTLKARDTLYFGIGAIADRAYGWGDYVGTSHDWTYHAFKVTGGPSAGIQANEATLPFARLLCDQPGPVHCYNGSHVFGFMLDVNQGNRVKAWLHDVKLSTSLTAGPLIAVGGCYSPTFERLQLSGGGQNIASLGGVWSYPVAVRDCELGGADIGYFGHGQSIWAERLNFQFPKTGAMRLQQCTTCARDTFISGGFKTKNVIEMRDGGIGVFDFGQADYEGAGPAAYFAAESAMVPTVLRVSNWFLGNPAGVADVSLTAGPGPSPAGSYRVDVNAGKRAVVKTIDLSWSQQ